MSKRSLRVKSGNRVDVVYHSGLGVLVGWKRKPPSDEDMTEFRRVRARLIRSVLPADRSFVVLSDRPGTYGRIEIVPRIPSRKVACR